MSSRPHHVAITGASSGIGAALARHYAGPGVTLALLGRNRERLEAVAADCRHKGAAAEAMVGDVTDRVQMAEWIAACEARAPVDLFLANAGQGGVQALAEGPGEAAATTAALFAANVMGAANCVAPLLARMMARGAGQIAIISSLAGLLGLPQAPGYSASKAAVAAYGDALRRLAAPSGVRISVVYPGFVDTPMSEGVPLRHLFLWDASRAARFIAAKLARGQGRIFFPWQMTLMLRLGRLLPAFLLDSLIVRFGRVA
jgi:short-subunit dehydrogenase